MFCCSHWGSKLFIFSVFLLGLTGCIPSVTSYIPTIISLLVPSTIPVGQTVSVSVTVKYTGGGLLTYSWDDGPCNGTFSPNHSFDANNSLYTAPSTTGTCAITIKVITRSGRFSSSSATTTIVPLQTAKLIGPEGGELSLPNGVSVSIPQDFLTGTTEVILSTDNSPILPLLPNTETITPDAQLVFDTTYLASPTPRGETLIIRIPAPTTTGAALQATSAALLEANNTVLNVIRWILQIGGTQLELTGYYTEVAGQVIVEISQELLWELLENQRGETLLELVALNVARCFDVEPKLFQWNGSYWQLAATMETDKKPLLLIHGLQPLELICRKDPLALTIEAWHEFVEVFNSRPELQNQYSLFSFTYNTALPISIIGDQLKQKIGNSDHLNIVAHSMGGLVARSMMIEKGGESQVDRLITLGTPHHGSPLANPESFPYPIWCAWWRPITGADFLIIGRGAHDLRWDRFNGDNRFLPNVWLENLNLPNPDHERKILAYDGDLFPERMSFKGKCLRDLGYTANDDIVPVVSAQYTDRLTFDQLRHFVDYNHNEIRSGKIPNDELFTKICHDLGGCNGLPIANSQSVTTNQDTPVTITLTGSDPDNDPLTFSISNSPTHGTLGTITQLDSTSAQVTYTPNTGFVGPDSFTFIVNDSTQDSIPATVSIMVQDTSPPALVVDFQASDGEESQSTLTWTNPSDSDLSEVIVRRKIGSYPTNHNDGDLVYQNASPTPAASIIYTDTGLTNSTVYYYAVFSRDQAGNWNDQVVEGQNADTGTPQTVIIINGHPWPMGNYDAQNTSRSQNLGPNSPTVAWSTNLGLTERVIVAGDGTLYLSRDNDVCAVQGQTITWCFPTPQFYRRPPAIGADGTVYAGAVVRNPDGTASGRLYAINPDGSPKWEINLTWLPSSPIVGPDGSIYVSAGDTLYAVNPDGSVRWTFTMPGISFLPYPPALGSDDTVYATVDRSENYGSPGLYAINPNGSKKWFVNTTAMPTSPPVVDTTDGSIYVARTLVAPCWAREALIALRPDGSLKWQFDQWNCGFRVGTPAVGPDGTVYVTQGALWAFDPNTGQPKWSFHPGGFGFSETVAIDTEGIIYVGASYGTLYALRSNGEVKWQVTFNPGQNIWYGASIGADRTIYIQTISFLYAIGEGSVNRSSHGVSRISQRIVNNEERIRDFEFHIFNLTGRLVFHIRQIADGFVWNGLDMQGRTVPNGVYFVVITTRRDDGTIIKREVKKLVILR